MLPHGALPNPDGVLPNPDLRRGQLNPARLDVVPQRVEVGDTVGDQLLHQHRPDTVDLDGSHAAHPTDLDHRR